MWELTVVSVLAMAALALVAGPAAAAAVTSRRRMGRALVDGRARWALRAPFVVLALGLVIAQAIPFAAKRQDRGEPQAGGHAEIFPRR